jgi:hypothetical protein
MNRKEKQQQTRFNKEIEPLLDQLSALCVKYDMPMLAAVQLFENEETGARVSAQSANQEIMALPMLLSQSLLSGETKVVVKDNNTLQLLLPKADSELQNYMSNVETDSAVEGDFEPLTAHAATCEECNEIMEELILQGTRVDNILVPKHNSESENLIADIKKSKMPFIMPREYIIH